MKSLEGHFLVASPKLQDPNFIKTVVLLLEHNKQGAFGVVLNRRISKSIRDLWEEVQEPPCESQQCLNLGGPVAGPLLAIHTHAPLGGVEVLPGIYFCHDKTQLENLVQQQQHAFKLFVGHSGWGGGQLENEIQQGAWLTAPATAEDVFSDEDLLWTKLFRHIGSDSLCSLLKIKNLPADPTLN
jgi:putative transcriptional regulator